MTNSLTPEQVHDFAVRLVDEDLRDFEFLTVGEDDEILDALEDVDDPDRETVRIHDYIEDSILPYLRDQLAEFPGPDQY